MRQIRVVIADDHAIVREGLHAILDRQPDFNVVAQASGGQEAIRHYRTYLPDVLLSDLNMPDCNGDVVVRVIRAEFPSACIIIMSAADDGQQRALEVKADAFVPKDAPREQLLHALRSALRKNAAPAG